MIAALDREAVGAGERNHHAPEFQKLEGAWRGLHYLVFNSETDANLKINVMNICKTEFTVTALLSGRALGPEPAVQEALRAGIRPARRPALWRAGRRLLLQPPRGDIELMRDISKIAAAAHAPFFAAANPELMGMDSWKELANPRDLGKLFDTPEYAAWRGLRDTNDSPLSRPVHASVPVARALWRQVRTGRGIRLRGRHRRTRRQDYAWMNAAYAMAANSIAPSRNMAGARAFAAWNRAAKLQLPTHTFPTDDGGVDLKCPTEIAISDRREAELAKSGLMPLIHRKNTDKAAFIGAQSSTSPRIRRPEWRRGDRGRQPVGAPALHVRLLAFRALPEMHRARQSRLDEGKGATGAVAA